MTAGSAPITRHIVALDVIRGIAATVVLLGHCTLVYGLPSWARAAADALLNQRAAVLIFFVLSGFVLTHSWQRLRAGYAGLGLFYVRRFFRLMPALWVATAAALLLLHQFPLGTAHGHLSEWMHQSYQQVSTRREILSFLAIDNAVVPPTWTITVEIIGSVLMPLLVGILARGKLFTLCALAGSIGISLLVSELPTRLSLAAFLVQFVVGCAVALHVAQLRRERSLLLAVAGLIFLFGARPLIWWMLTGAVQPIEYRTNAAIPALLETAGAALLVGALASDNLRWKILQIRPMRALGEWSYSIYLIHFPVLRVFAYFIPPMEPVRATIVLMICTLATTLALSRVIFYLIERPGIALGKKLTSGRFADAKLVGANATIVKASND